MLLEFKNVVKRFGDNTVVDNVSFNVDQGEFFTLLGPSGCGKTTTLRLLAGLEVPDGGEIILEDRCLADPARKIYVPPDKRNVGMMFQSYAIWPHLTVFENVAFPLRVRRERAADIRRRVTDALEIVGLAGMAQRGATQLSGGQQQRVALARAIVYTPSVLLLDEPLSNLDVKLREQMRVELRALQQRLNLAVVYVTHDQAEALSLSDRIAMFNKGKLEQVGSPKDLYERPRTRFVGDFLGRTVVVRGNLHRDGGSNSVEIVGCGRIAVPATAEQTFAEGQRLRVLSRPEEVEILPAGDAAINQLACTVQAITYMGDHLEYTIDVGGHEVVLPAAKKQDFPVGSPVRLAFNPASVTLLP